jgi:hypothetical protein
VAQDSAAGPGGLSESGGPPGAEILMAYACRPQRKWSLGDKPVQSWEHLCSVPLAT